MLHLYIYPPEQDNGLTNCNCNNNHIRSEQYKTAGFPCPHSTSPLQVTFCSSWPKHAYTRDRAQFPHAKHSFPNLFSHVRSRCAPLGSEKQQECLITSLDMSHRLQSSGCQMLSKCCVQVRPIVLTGQITLRQSMLLVKPRFAGHPTGLLKGPFWPQQEQLPHEYA